MFLELEQTRLFFETAGQGVPLLCLPAFPYDHRIYHGQMVLQDLARLVFVDYPGTGRSRPLVQSMPGVTESRGAVLDKLWEGISWPATTPPVACTVEQLAAVFLKLMDALAIEHFVVMGVSMGGYVAMAMQAAAPTRILGLVLADTRSDADSAEAFSKRHETICQLMQHGSKCLQPRLPGMMASATLEQQPGLIQQAITQLADHSAVGLAQLTTALALRPDRGERLAHLQVPCLVLCGEEDSLSPVSSMRQLAERIPNADFHIIHDAGHLSPWEQPAQVNEHIRRFLARIPGIKTHPLG